MRNKLISILWLIVILFGVASICRAQDYEIVERTQSITVQSNSYAVEHHREVAKMLATGAHYRKIVLVNSYIQVSNVSGVVILPGGRRVSIDDNDVMEIPAGLQSSTITDAKVLLIMAPVWLPANATITVDYDVNIKSLMYLSPWVFSTTAPIRKNSCTLTYPSDLEIKYYGQDSQIQSTTNKLGGKVIVSFESPSRSEVSLVGERQDLGSVESEIVFVPLRSATDRWILSTENWQSVAKWFTDISVSSDQWDASMDAALQPTLSKLKTPEEIAAALYQYVQNNFSYSAVEMGIGGFKPRPAMLTYARKSGDCKDLALLYVALLRKAGIEAYPALVSTRSPKLFNADFPNPRQFNHCIVYLPGIRNGTWVDCTVKQFRLGEIPSSVQGRFALVTGGPDKLIKIPEDFVNSTATRIRLNGSLAENELDVTGSLELGADDSYLVPESDPARLSSNIQSWFLNPQAPVQDLKIAAQSSRAVQVSYKTPVVSVDPYKEFLVNALSYETLQYVNESVTPGKVFALGDPQHRILETTIDLKPKQYPFARINKEKAGKYLSYRVQLFEESGKLHYNADVFFRNGLLDATEMSELQTEIKSLQNDLLRSVYVR